MAGYLIIANTVQLRAEVIRESSSKCFPGLIGDERTLPYRPFFRDCFDLRSSSESKRELVSIYFGGGHECPGSGKML
jgi:hypothetical protein